MVGEGESKTVATTPAMSPPATLPAINTPTPATEASMEDVATFVQPLAMIPAEGNSRGPMGVTLRSADLPGRLTRGSDIQRPHSAARSPSPLKIARSRARAHSPYGRPSREAPVSSRPIVQQLFKDGAATESPVLPQTARVAPVTQKCAPEAVQGGNLNTDFKRSEEERCRQSFAKEGQISVVSCKAQGRHAFRGTHHHRPHRDGPVAMPGE